MPEVINKKVVAIEYPRESETIASNNYTFRIVAMSGVKHVEISINDSAWEPCRHSGDSWWYDWSGYGAGEYEVAARVRLANGHFHTTEHRFFTVELGDRSQNGGERRTLSPRRAQQYLGRPDLHKHMVSKYVVVVPNEPGVLGHLTHLLSREGVNVDSILMETLGDVASFRFMVEKENGLRPMLEAEGFHVVEDKVFRLDLPNRPGELDRLTRKLSEQGVAVRYLYGTSHGRTTKVVFAVDRPDCAIDVVKQLDQRLISVEA
jgi:hypothetical protein